MDKVKKRELYSFEIKTEKEEVKEVIKEVKRKNKKTKKMETVEETVEKTITTEVPVKVVLRKPTRTQIEDGDMFYSIWLNKFIKMGLLTRAMLAKKQVDVGGSMNDDDKVNYARLYLQLFEKQQNVIRYSAKDPDSMSLDDKERLENAISDLAVIRKQISDFEAAQASIFDHTADVKARNKTITWFLLHLAYYAEENEGDEEEKLIPMFPGTDYDEKYISYQESDENQEELFTKAIDRLSTVATIWYMSGVQEQDEFDAVIDQMNQESNVDAPSLSEEVEEEDEEIIEEEAVEEEAVEEEAVEEEAVEEEAVEEEAVEEEAVEEEAVEEEVAKEEPQKKRGRPSKK